MSVLEDLFGSPICVNEKFNFHLAKEDPDLYNKLTSSEKALTKTLSEEQKNLFAEYQNDSVTATSAEVEAMFTFAFKYGFRMAMEILCDKN